MKPTWIVIADGSRARLFEQAQPAGPWSELRAWVNPATRLRTESLAFDQLGRAAKGQPGATSFVPRTSPRQREHRRFAHELARHLDLGVRSGRCDGLVLIASNSLLGELRQALPTQATKRVRWSAPVDLTSFSGRELQARVEALRPAPAALPEPEAGEEGAGPGAAPWAARLS
jgi:protein required for attachment to host cells